jgi:hypothetical protein
MPVRQFDIEPLASVIQSDPHGLYCNVQQSQLIAETGKPRMPEPFNR